MRSKFYNIKPRVENLRKEGKTYGEIIKIIGYNIPKSTLSDWCSKIYLTNEQKKILDNKIKKNCTKGILIAWSVNKKRREKYLKSIIERNQYLSKTLKSKDICKVALSMLYLGEGSKSLNRSSLRFGNSDPFVIDLFLNLLKKCYKVDERKFRCTVLCRADQNIKQLEEFWLKVTKIPKSQFYKTRIDPRTIGKTSQKLDYKGVCVIDYFSADIFLDLMQIPKSIHHGPVAQW